jgi:hypothetical protein
MRPIMSKHGANALRELDLEDLEKANGGKGLPNPVDGFTEALKYGIEGTIKAFQQSDAPNLLENAKTNLTNMYNSVTNYFSPTPGNGAPGDIYVPAAMNPNGTIDPSHHLAPTPPGAENGKDGATDSGDNAGNDGDQGTSADDGDASADDGGDASDDGGGEDASDDGAGYGGDASDDDGGADGGDGGGGDGGGDGGGADGGDGGGGDGGGGDGGGDDGG